MEPFTLLQGSRRNSRAPKQAGNIPRDTGTQMGTRRTTEELQEGGRTIPGGLQGAALPALKAVPYFSLKFLLRGLPNIYIFPRSRGVYSGGKSADKWLH